MARAYLVHVALLPELHIHFYCMVLGHADCVTLNNFTTVIILHSYREENITAFLIDSLYVTFKTVMRCERSDINIRCLDLGHLLPFKCLKKQKTFCLYDY